MKSFSKMPLSVRHIIKQDIQTGDVTGKQIVNKLKIAGVGIGNRARQILSDKLFASARAPEQITLVMFSPNDLGFDGNPLLGKIISEQFCSRWSSVNLDDKWEICLCEPEDAPQLCLQCQHWYPLGRVYIAMHLINVNSQKKTPCIFIMRRGIRGKWELGTHSHVYNPDIIYADGTFLVYRLKRNTPST
jgi:hypothetical protein